MASQTTIKFTSLNVKGLQNNRKRRLALQDMKRSGGDIIFLQETHFTSQDPPNLFKKVFPMCFFASFTSKKRGVAVLIRQGTPFNHIKTTADPEGRFLVVYGSLAGSAIALINVYAPNENQTEFLKRVLEGIDPGYLSSMIDPSPLQQSCGKPIRQPLEGNSSPSHPTGKKPAKN
ncbi:hypothetical protein FKM82_019709 [Ascaphus truei]